MNQMTITKLQCEICGKPINGGCYNTPNGLFCVDCWENKVTKQLKKDCERKVLRRLQSLSGGFVSGLIEQTEKRK